MFSIKARVPERAIVPMFSSTSDMVMPMPLSLMVSVPAPLSGVILIFQSALPSRRASLEWA